MVRVPLYCPGERPAGLAATPTTLPLLLALSQVPPAGVVTAAVAPLTASVPCPPLPTEMLVFCEPPPWTAVKDSVAGLACAIGEVVTVRLTGTFLLSGLNGLPDSAICP